MIRQYGAQRFTLACPPIVANRRVGTIPVGTILYIQHGIRPFSGSPFPAICREPWIVEAWLPRDYSKWDPRLQKFRLVRISGGHLAQVRSLRDQRRVKQVADWILLRSIDAGLERQICLCRKSPITKVNRISRPSPNSITGPTTPLSKTVCETAAGPRSTSTFIS